MSELLWHPIPGRLQSVSVAKKSSIWGVTLDLQLAKFNTSTRQWQLVSVTSEQATRDRYSSSSSSAPLNNTLRSRSSTMGSVSERASKTIAALLPSFGMGSGIRTNSGGATSLSFDGFLSPRAGEDEEDEDTTMQVSAAADGTVVRLDKTLKAWYLIGPHNEKVDLERDVIWIELGHLWKCVSVASISQIWGLSNSGEIYYGSSDRFLQLEAAVTSGAGYGQPNFTHISVGLDDVVLATDAHTGTVFRLKKPDTTTTTTATTTKTTAAHPPIWKALPGTGPQGLHMANCSLSTSDFIVGVARDGHCYRFCNNRWVGMGGGAKLNNVGVGADGYVIGVDRDGDLFGYQLESIVVPRPKTISTNGKFGDDNHYKQEYEAMEMPKTPTQQKSFSRRPIASPRELFEMAVNDRGNNDVKLAMGVGGAVSVAATMTGRSPLGATSTSPYSPRGNAYSRYTVARSESQLSKRSYASDIASGRSTPTGLYIIQSEESTPPQEASPASSESELDMLSPHPKSPLRIHTKRADDSYFAPFPQGDAGHQKSPASGFPVDGNPYTATRSLASSQTNSQHPSPGSAAQAPMASTTIGPSSLSNDLTKELSPSKGDHDNSNNKGSDSDNSMDLAKVRRIHAHALAKKNGGEENNKQSTGSTQQQGEHAKPLTPPPDVEVQTSSFEQEEGPGEKAEVEVLDVLPTEPENIRQELFVVTKFDKEDGNSGIGGRDTEENHNENTHLHSPPMTTPEEDKKQPFTTTASNGLEPLPSAPGGLSLMDKGMNHKVGGDTLHVQQVLKMAPDHLEDKMQFPVPSFDEVTVHKPQPYQPYQPQHSQQHSTPSSFPEKQEAEYLSIASLYPPDQRPGSTHRSSGGSDEWMLQQQEFLRLTRLRSQSLKNNLDNNFNIGKSEFDNIKEEEPPAIPLQSFYSLSTKTHDYPTHPDYPGPYQHQHQSHPQQQQEAKQEYHPYFNSTTPLASPPNTTNNNTKYVYSNNDMPIGPMVADMVPSRIPELPPINSCPSSQPPSSPRIQSQPLQPSQAPPPSPGKKEADPDDEAPSRPSYSSSHLQNYVDTTMVLQSGLASAERRQSQGQLAGLTGYQQSLRQRTSGGGVQGLASQGGIQGEDEHGRWIGGARPGSQVRQWGTEDVHKGKCCTIL